MIRGCVNDPAHVGGLEVLATGLLLLLLLSALLP